MRIINLKLVFLLVVSIAELCTSEPAMGMLIQDIERAIAEADSASRTLPPAVEATATGLREPPLRVAAFNIQIFGKRKMKNKAVVDILIKTLSRFDLVLVQEIRDSSKTAFPTLMDKLNRSSHGKYKYVLSKRLGRSNSKEQYAYIYNQNRVREVQSYQYPDPGDKFEREPFCVHFQSLDSAVPDFGVVGVHTKPSAAETEISALVEVYEDVVKRFRTQDVIMMGDFNADCSYVTGAEMRKVALRTDARFTWLIGDDVDTTVSNSNCAYDRFVIAGSRLKKGVVPGSAQPFRFDSIMKLSADLAKDVSDHYPIQLEIYGKLSTTLLAARTTGSFSVKSLESATPAAVKALRQGHTVAGFSVSTVVVTSTDVKSFAELSWGGACSGVVKAMTDIRELSSGLLSAPFVSVVDTYLQAGTLSRPSPIPGLELTDDATSRDCNVVIRYVTGDQCCDYTVTVSRRIR